MRILSIFLLLAAISFTACEKETDENKTQTLEIAFKAEYNEQPLQMYQDQTITETGLTAIQFKRLEFFLSNIKLKSASTTHELTDVAYVDLTNKTTLEGATEGIVMTYEDVPVGNYTSIEMGFGLPDAVNETTPGDYSSDSPLAVNGNYWASWSSYILSKIEGGATKSDSTSVAFLYHSGVNGMLNTKEFTHSIEVSADGVTRLTFIIKAEDLFFKAGSEIDILTNNSTHSGAAGSDEYNLAKLSLDNLANATEMSHH